ncbi:MAG TPA: NAD(P)-dependent oxidoreductase [Acetobacteraceae bacterium]|jgi:precorrin-2 dehydrogenase/sirohydrochlorin ferrochelatase|nr:NAD(P)-dependent oxidoreductase [Acetobacteraceae bacterium]
MIAIALDPAVAAVAVAGRGPDALRRFAALQAGGVHCPLLYCDRPDGVDHIPAEALRSRLPDASDLAGLRALWIAGLPDDEAASLAALARSMRVLVNVEDRPALCDFHSVAEVRRGDLLLTVSTNGASPRLAARIRARLAAEYSTDWADRLGVLRARRAAWRRDGGDLSALTDALLEANGWLA